MMQFHIISIAHAGWFGLDAGDWLTAITNMLAIIIAILIAAKIAPKAEERRARRDQQERLLRILIATSPLPANPDYQGAIALIPIDFKGNQRILDARLEYLAVVNTPPPEEEQAAVDHYKMQTEKQADLIAVIAQELDFDLTSEGLRSGAYISKGFVDREQLQIEAMRSWARIADALDRNNQMVAWSLSQSQAAPAVDEPAEHGGAGQQQPTSK
jgi:hypothetical protein